MCDLCQDAACPCSAVVFATDAELIAALRACRLRLSAQVAEERARAEMAEAKLARVWLWWREFLREDVDPGDVSGSRYPIDQLEPDTQNIMRGFQRLRDNMRKFTEGDNANDEVTP